MLFYRKLLVGYRARFHKNPMKKIQKYLTRLYQSGDEDNFITILDDPFYLQILCGRNSPRLFIVAVSNAHLIEEEKLTKDQEAQILMLGYVIDPKSGNYSIEMPMSLEDIPKIADFIEKTSAIYDINLETADFEEEID